MTRSLLGRTAASAAFALALGFGAHQAVAAPAADADRRPYCSDDADCQRTCERLYPGYDGFADCSSGKTCYCY